MRPTRAFATAIGFAALAVLAPFPAVGQPARLLVDVSDRPLDHANRFLLPPSAVVLDGIVYFAHDDGVAGQELWRSDGTEAGTWRVRDICPGRCWARITEITVVGARLFFGADDGVHGNEPWASDGTEAGTRLVADLAPGLPGSRPEWITAFGERVFFTADDGTTGREPWVFDATGEPRSLGDLQPGPAPSRPSSPVVIPGGLLFFADDGATGREPWYTDGTPARTRLVEDIRSGSEASVWEGQQYLRYPTTIEFRGRAWFEADDGVHGPELWFSDGTSIGTALAADLQPGAWGSSPTAFVATPSRLYFRAGTDGVGKELFSTDGDSIGLIADLEPGAGGSHPLPIAVLDDILLFVAHVEGLGNEIWKTNGNPGGTELVVDLEPGPAGGAQVASHWPARTVGGHLFFGNGPHFLDTELWRTDGTAEGTRIVADIWPGDGAGLPVLFGTVAPPVELDGRLFFFASHPELGWEPWLSDGTPAGTAAVRDIYESSSSQLPFIFDIDFSLPVDASGRLYFIGASWETLAKPWTSRGTPQSTHRVTAPAADDRSFQWPVAPIGRRQILVAQADADLELWITDEEGEQMSLLAQVEGSGGFGTSFDGRAFFDVDEGLTGRLWTSDGSPGGTGKLVDEPPFAGGFPAPFAALDHRLYFRSSDGNLWSTDGSASGTSHVADLPTGFVGSALLVESGGRLFFPTSSPTTGIELWTSDGTEGGTLALPEVAPGPEPGLIDALVQGNPTNVSLVPVPGGVAFVGDDGASGQEPWWSDGEGVFRVGDLRPGPRGSEPRWLTSSGGTLFFAADDGAHGRELWRWRPGETAALVEDLVAGPGSSVPQELAGVDGVLYFAAFRPDTGVELWRSDSTAAGTVLVQDVFPGPESSTPSRLTVSGRYLYFTANDGVHGREMWSLLLPTRRPRATLTADGVLIPGRHVRLTLRLENPPPEELPDGDGDELRLPLPAVLEVVGLTASGGTAAVETGAAAAGPRAAALGGSTVTWNGSLPPGGVVEVIVIARVAAPASTALALQATGGFDSDGDGTNDEPLRSDDPSVAGDEDATALALAIEVPALGPGALALLAAALGLLALRRLRRAAA